MRSGSDTVSRQHHTSACVYIDRSAARPGTGPPTSHSSRDTPGHERISEAASTVRTASTVAGALLRTAVRTSIDAVERRQFDSEESARLLLERPGAVPRLLRAAAHYWLSRLLSELAGRTLPYTALVYTAEGPRSPQDLVHAVPVLPSYVQSAVEALERAADAVVAEASPPLPLEFDLAGSGLDPMLAAEPLPPVYLDGIHLLDPGGGGGYRYSSRPAQQTPTAAAADRGALEVGESLPLEDNVSRVMCQLAAAGVGCGRRPVVFVAHSMGGLLVKEMLARSMDQAEAGGGPNAALAASTRGVVFFGTPHFGNGMAAMGWRLRHLPGAYPAASLARLTPGPHLLSLNARLHALHEQRPGQLRVVSLLEGLPTQLSGVIPRILVVGPDSAYPGFGAALTLPHNDHIDCCKPAGTAAPGYVVRQAAGSDRQRRDDVERG
eukprot:XP_001692099.1 predicted protein [Chlamydomonas reinhardtii]